MKGVWRGIGMVDYKPGMGGRIGIEILRGGKRRKKKKKMEKDREKGGRNWLLTFQVKESTLRKKRGTKLKDDMKAKPREKRKKKNDRRKKTREERKRSAL